VTSAAGHAAAELSPGGLVHLLDLEQVDTLVFRGAQPDDVKRQVFGGQVIAQSLMTAFAPLGPGARCIRSIPTSC